jgi:signal transduction histidine kinase
MLPRCWWRTLTWTAGGSAGERTVVGPAVSLAFLAVFLHDERLIDLLGDGAMAVTSAFDRMPDGLGILWPVREEGRIVDFETGYANPAAERMFGFPLAERVGARLFAELPFLVEAGHLDRFRRVMDTGIAEEAEMHMDGAWGEVHPTQGLWWHRAVPLGPALLSYFTDITAARRRQAEVAQYANVAAQDMREPLSSMALLVGLLRRREEVLTPEIREVVELLGTALRGAQDMVDGISDYSRASVVRPEEVDLAALAGEVLARLDAQLIDAGASVLVGELPVVRADRAQLGRVLQNLVANALRFRATDRPLRVEIGATRGDGVWTVTVADNGIGIPQDNAIFELFVRRGESNGELGAGIGLAVCRRVVRAHGGAIWAERRDGAGSLFSFTLPG